MARKAGFLLFLVAAAATIALAACGGGAGSAGTAASASSPSNGSLTYSLKTVSGGLSYEVSDTRPGNHTVWVVLLNPPKGTNREWLALKTGETQAQYGGAQSLPAGTYRYAVYSVDGHIDGAGNAYWTPENRVGGGEVTVP